MEQVLNPGFPVWTKLPYGEFIVEENPDSRVLLVAGGTGISPFVPFLEGLLERGESETRITAFYGARRKDLLVFAPLLERAAEKVPGFQVRFYSEEETGAPGRETGKIAYCDVFEEMRDSTRAKAYLSGPPGMISFFKEQLCRDGVPKESILSDAWE